MLNKFIDITSRYIHIVIMLLTWVASIMLGMMALLIVSNILGRFLFDKPVLGTIELVELATVVVVFFSLAYTEIRRGHVRVELVTSQLPISAQTILVKVMSFLSVVYFLVMGWQSGELMWSYLFPSVKSTNILSIPIAPFMFIIAFGSVLLAFEILRQINQPIRTKHKLEK